MVGISSLSEIRSQLPSTVKIVAVSKLQSVEKIRELYQQGQRQFAENYVQEALEKQESLKDLNIEWHFIGRLQKNKAKFVVGNFSLIHSVDSLELAQVLDRKAQEKSLTQKILIQLNLSNEQTKGGFSEQNLAEMIEPLKALKSVQISGLMTMPPLFEQPEQARVFFKKLYDLRKIYSCHFPSLSELSMGTSSDYRVASEEGATLIRLGSILFGERPS
jgi:pyridoxal phosphate enzyme (YggS family)